jgi:hypothetical protein
MAEAEDTRPKYEQAKDCPKCGKQGDVRRVSQGKDGRGRPVEHHLVYCTTELCRWFETPWVITVYEDGSIPDAYSKVGDKQFVRLSQESQSRVTDAIRTQLEVEQRKGGGEVRNPHG